MKRPRSKLKEGTKQKNLKRSDIQSFFHFFDGKTYGGEKTQITKNPKSQLPEGGYKWGDSESQDAVARVLKKKTGPGPGSW